MDSAGGSTSPTKHHNSEPPEQLLQAFKTAALSVTKLYRTAADQGHARSEGYQEALDDLLIYMDKENIGLNEGEGWKIRRWATERLDGRDAVSQTIESDDEVVEKADRAPSPVAATATSTNPPSNESPNTTVPSSSFTFRSSQAFPQDADVTLSALNLSDTRPQTQSTTSHVTNTPSGHATIRTPRTNSRHNNPSTRINTRSTTTLGRGAGQKRKVNPLDFFDFSSLGHSKDGFGGGGKRSRFA